MKSSTLPLKEEKNQLHENVGASTCKIILTDDMFFIIDANCFVLFKKGKKTNMILGYFTTIKSLIQKAVQITLSGKNITKRSFLEGMELLKETTEMIVKRIPEELC